MKRNNRKVAAISWQWLVAVVAAALIVFGLSLFLGKGQDVWFDEGYSILLAKQSVGTLVSLTGVDAHPPLYYLLLKAWGSTFGWGELTLRTLSAVFAALGVAAMAALLRRLFTKRVALAALPFLVISPFWLRYGYEIRMYALAGLICIIGSIALLRAVEAKTNKRAWLLYALIVALGMYTLYMTAVIWIAHVVWLLLRDRRRFWRQPWFLAYVGAFVLFLPYLPTLIFQETHSALPGIGQTLSLANIGGVLNMIMTYEPSWSAGALSAFGILVVLGLTIYLLTKAYGQLHGQGRESLRYLLCLALTPILFFVIVSLPLVAHPFFIPRYLAHTVLFVYALVGVAVALGWRYGYRRLAAVLGVVTFVLLIAGVVQLKSTGNFNFEQDHAQKTSDVRPKIDCQKSAVVFDDAYVYINDVYYFDGCKLYFYSTYPLQYQGGYAWLAHHGNRLSSPNQLTAKSIAYVHMGQTTFHPDSRYHLVSSYTGVQQTVDTYELTVR